MQEFDTITVIIIQGCENRQQMRSYRTNIEIIAKKRTCRYTVLCKLNSFQKMRTGNNYIITNRKQIFIRLSDSYTETEKRQGKDLGTANNSNKKQIVDIVWTCLISWEGYTVRKSTRVQRNLRVFLARKSGS